MENINGEIIDLCSDTETQRGLVEPMDHTVLQYNPAYTGSGIANPPSIFEEIDGDVPWFVVGGQGTQHFLEQIHHLPASGSYHPSASGICYPSGSGLFHPYASGPCHPSASGSRQPSASVPNHPSACGSFCPSASGPCHPSASGPFHPYASGTWQPSASGPCGPSAGGPEQMCRQFWKAGDYTPSLNYAAQLPGRQNRMCIHPKFLHSNATSHKWVFGAIAELLDNAIDEVVNGATFVKVDKLISPKDGSCCLVVQDDGGGMGPDSLRRCMGFGFSDKCPGSSIGQYGNGFKTSTMRIGADVIVFSRSMKERRFTQSVGLLSYTYLRKLRLEEIIVPAVDYEFEATRGLFKRLSETDEKFCSNLTILLSWSPFGTELELQKQFDEIGAHGTRIIVFNLWLNDAREMELDFKSDNQDIMLSGSPRAKATNNKVQLLNQMHIAKRYHVSLRVYAAILYLHLPRNFRIIICGRHVDPYYVVNDLEYRQCIRYKPQVGFNFEPEMTTVIGFLKGAPNLNVHGFCIYHKNRLILPFMPVVSEVNGRGRGVAGVLEANFIKPTHDKQDFEKSTLFQKLEIRLRDMTREYWDLHCHLLGYKAHKNIASKQTTRNMQSSTHRGHENMVTSLSRGPTEKPYQSLHGDTLREPLGNRPPSTGSNDLSQLFEPVVLGERNETRVVNTTGASRVKRQAILSTEFESTSHATRVTGGIEETQREHLRRLVSENKKLSSQCSEYEASEKELSLKSQLLELELQNTRRVYEGILAQLTSVRHGQIQRF